MSIARDNVEKLRSIVSEAPTDGKQYGRQNKVWTEVIASGGGSGIVESVVAGTNVAVDNTDPANPVVSSTDTVYTHPTNPGNLHMPAGGTVGQVITNTNDGVGTWQNASTTGIPNGAIGNINSPLLDLPLQNSLAMNKGVGSVTFTRASEATYIDRYGVLKTALANEARFEKDGLLIEGASTNIMLYSGDITSWSVSGGATVDGDVAEAPDGTTTADRINSGTDASYPRKTVAVTDDTYCRFSIYLKYDGNDWVRVRFRETAVWVDVKNGVIGTDFLGDGSTIEILSNGWIRIMCGIEAANTISKTEISPVAGNGSGTAQGTLLAWGAQLEELPFASSYIPTTDSAVTRVADACNVTIEDNLPNAINGLTATTEFDLFGYGIEQSIMSLGYERLSVSPSGKVYYAKNGITVTGNTSITLGVMNSVTLSSGNSQYLNGAFDVSNTNICRDGKPTRFTLGNHTGDTPMYGHLRSVKIYGIELNQTEIALLG